MPLHVGYLLVPQKEIIVSKFGSDVLPQELLKNMSLTPGIDLYDILNHLHNLWLKLSASLNIFSIMKTLLTSQLSSGWLKLLAPSNIDSMSVTSNIPTV